MYFRIHSPLLLFQYRPLAGKHQDKGLQTNRDMKPPLPVQVLGAITNIVLDPLLIFGLLGLPKNRNNRGSDCKRHRVNGRRCCSSKTRFPPSSRKKFKAGHIAKIYQPGVPNIIMQSAYTFCIFGLTMILTGFSDRAVTVLGLL